MTQANKGNAFHGVRQDANLDGTSSPQFSMGWLWVLIGLVSAVVSDSVLDGQAVAIREINEEPMLSWGEFGNLHRVFAVGIGIGTGLGVKSHEHIIA